MATLIRGRFLTAGQDYRALLYSIVRLMSSGRAADFLQPFEIIKLETGSRTASQIAQGEGARRWQAFSYLIVSESPGRHEVRW